MIIIALSAWMLACAGVTSCCIAARRGDESL
jgi:hypothetical protein